MGISTNGKRLFIARHGETVFNVAGRMQGMTAHTPLTWAGCEQASRMGVALREHVTDPAALRLVASPSGRALQTLALISEEIHADWHSHVTDDRLREIDIGGWEGRYYSDIRAEVGEFVDSEHRLFTRKAPQGEDYRDIATRLTEWIGEQPFDRDMLIISHGMTARVLRGLLADMEPLEGFGAPIAPSLSQGSMVMIRDGSESLVISGDGSGERA